MRPAKKKKNNTKESGEDASADTPMTRDSPKHNVQVVQGDFRDLISLTSMKNSNSQAIMVEKEHENWNMDKISSTRIDLITGTPPYFRVDFSSSSSPENTTKTNKDQSFHSTNNQNQEVITHAVIMQGGMPTSMQSAPARGEFRGGIEAFCQAASAMLTPPHGIFVVCENWLNDDRVWKGARDAGLIVESVWPVMGKAGKKNPLFAVYIMKKKSLDRDHGNDDERKEKKIRSPLVVRDENGKWTQEYANVMEAMSIPMIL